jgi:SAM-dependent methyltransferase
MSAWRRFGHRNISGKIRSVLPANYQPDWFVSSFDEEYERIYRYTDDSAERETRRILSYLGLSTRSQKQGSLFLDVGCGWGRHDLQLAKRRYRVVGVDISDTMLDKAMNQAADADVPAELDLAQDTSQQLTAYSHWLKSKDALLYMKCDMRNLPWSGEFDFALSLFTSFGYFPTDAENRRVLSGIYLALRPGGKLLIDVDNPSQFVRRRQGTASVVITGPDLQGHEVIRKQEYDVDRGRRVVEYISDDQRRRSIYLECELYDSEDMARLLEDSGFEVEALWGDFDGQRYNPALSPRLIVVASKPFET